MTAPAAAVSQGQVYGPELPTRAELDAATTVTLSAIGRHAPAAEVVAAAEREAGALHAYAHRPGAEAVLQAGI